jgi:glycosyltransferase involved in cell wall biosynthesis
MIRVLHITEDHSARNFGISGAVDAMARCMPEGIQPAIACTGAETIPLPPEARLYAFPTAGLARSWRFSPGAARQLEAAVSAADVVHVHGLWMWIQWAAAREARRQGKPFVLSVHGMLEPWIWQRQRWPHRLKKYLYWKGLGYPAFRRAAAVHALTPREAGTLEAYFPAQLPVIIPNGIDLDTVDAALKDLPPPVSDAAPYILFLGRLHPVKAIHLLIRAFARLPQGRLRLVIAGPAQPQEQAYADGLHSLVAELGLEAQVSFTGAVTGAAKWQLYRDAWAVCLPSYTEGLSLVALEAAACRTPVITTHESGVVAEWGRCGGILVYPEEGSIMAGLDHAQGWLPAERKAHGETLRALVERRYGWETVGRQWAGEYERLMGAGAHV